MKQYRVALFAALGVVVVIVAWYAVLWRPETAHLKTARTNEAQAAAEVSQAQGQLAMLRLEQPKVRAEQALFHKLVQAVPNGPSLDQLFRTINGAAKAAGVSITTLGTPAPSSWGTASTPASASGPTATTAPSGPGFLTLGVTVNGTNAQILKFVSSLDSQPRIYVVESFGLTAPVVGGASTANGAPASVNTSGGSTNLSVEAFYVSSGSNNPTFPG